MTDPRPTREQLEELALAHLLGALDGAEARVFEALLAARDAELLALLAENRATAEALLLVAPAVVPPPELKARILDAARSSAGAPDPTAAGADEVEGAARPLRSFRPESSAPRSVRRPSVWAGLALAAMAALAVISWQSARLRDRLERTERAAAAARRRTESLAAELEAVKAGAAAQAELVRLLQDPASGLITLAALKPAPGVSARVLWDAKARRGYLWVRNLAADGADRDYQLWALEGDRPVSAGVFSVDDAGAALVPLAALGVTAPVGAFAITLEPAGGLAAPTGEILLLGNVGG